MVVALPAEDKKYILDRHPHRAETFLQELGRKNWGKDFDINPNYHGDRIEDYTDALHHYGNKPDEFRAILKEILDDATTN